MKHKLVLLASLMTVIMMLLSACSPVGLSRALGSVQAQAADTATPAESEELATPQATKASPVTSVSAGANPLTTYENALTAVYEKVSPSIVSIRVMTQGPRGMSGGQGSGFIWDSEGHIVTNNHVIDGADTINVILSDGTSTSAKVVGRDAASDLAVIKLDESGLSLTPIQVGDSSLLKVGEVAIALGNPYGLANTMTVGIISAVGRSLDAGSSALDGIGYSNPDIIQTDAPINPGNSGGALVDENGLLIGVPTAIESTSGANSGIGFAVPSDTVKRIVPVLIQDGSYTYAWLGIQASTLTSELAKAMDLDAGQRGVLVAEVTAGGPADSAGLKGSSRSVTINSFEVNVGGDVITAIDGQTIRTMDALISYLTTDTRPGQEVVLSILRDGKPIDLTVTLGDRSDGHAGRTACGNGQIQSDAGNPWEWQTTNPAPGSFCARCVPGYHGRDARRRAERCGQFAGGDTRFAGRTRSNRQPGR